MQKENLRRVIKSTEEMRSLAQDLAQEVLNLGVGENSKVVALVGDLGAGKTTFAQGFAEGLGMKERVLSPTFLIFRKYDLNEGGFKNFYHADIYRIRDFPELEVLEFDRVLKNPENIVLIEWAEKIKEFLPKDTKWLRFEHGEVESERVVFSE